MTKEELLNIAKPIFFNTEMVRAILEYRKTVTRRVVKCYPLDYIRIDSNGKILGVYDKFSGCIFPITDYSPYKAGDILYVRETWLYAYDNDEYTDQPIEDSGRFIYRADDDMPFSYWVDTESGEHKDNLPWKPSIHMPKEAARIFLKITGVRVERLQDITDEQAKKEGVNRNINYINKFNFSAIDRFIVIWDSTIKKQDFSKYGWNANPWVWVYEFERIEL